MEVDDDNVSAGLLEQLNSLQTLDKEDLVSQMLRLIGNGDSVNVDTAKFYLEMNGWNVQAAVCAYFDLEAGPEARKAMPSMTFIKDVTIGEGESVPPATMFVKTWKVQNTGGDNWPDGCVLVHTQGTLMTADGSNRKEVGAQLMPWQMLDISIEMKSPNEPGIYESKWRMSTNTGNFFGDTIWVIITVEASGTMALTQQMNNFNVVGVTSLSSAGAEAPAQVASDTATNGGGVDPLLRTVANPFSVRKSDEEAMD